MAPRYERVRNDDEDNGARGSTNLSTNQTPNSPPPSFRSRSQSPVNDESSALVDSFDAPSDDEDDLNNANDMRNVRGTRSSANTADSASFQQESVPLVARTRFTVLAPSSSNDARRPGGGRSIPNDGVFANLSAKPSANSEKPAEEHPPSYEAAAADATPPYWETTILAPGMSSDDVFIDGLPVGSVFAFVWNALVSLSFQFVGFLLTYLLHTTHAAKNGSRAGLGITLVQYGFYMRSTPTPSDPSEPSGSTPESYPPDPNSYDFATSGLPDAAQDAAGDADSIGRNEWLSYVLMVVGWFILIRAVSDFLRARRTEQVVLASPDRGLGVAVVADNEHPDSSV